MLKKDINGKKVSVIGLGISNIPAIKYLNKQGAYIIARDKKEEIPEDLKELENIKRKTTIIKAIGIFIILVGTIIMFSTMALNIFGERTQLSVACLLGCITIAIPFLIYAGQNEEKVDIEKYNLGQTKEAKKNQKVMDVKEVRLGLSIDVHDFETKGKHAIRFLQDGDKVKVSIRFRGRELGHPEIGLDTMNRFAEFCKDYCSVEKPAKMEGRNMLMFLAPKSSK